MEPHIQQVHGSPERDRQQPDDPLHDGPEREPDPGVARRDEYLPVWGRSPRAVWRERPGVLPGRCAGQRAADGGCEQERHAGNEIRSNQGSLCLSGQPC